MVVSSVLFGVEKACGQATVQLSTGKLKVEDEGVVQEFLNVEGDLHIVDGAIVGKEEFDWNVEARIIVRVSVEFESYGDERRGFEKNVNPCEVLGQRGRLLGHLGKLLRSGEVVDKTTIVRFLADEFERQVLCGSERCKREGREDSALVHEIVESRRVRDAIRAGPASGRRVRRRIHNLAAGTSCQSQVQAVST